MSRATPEPALGEVEALIQATYSDNRPDPEVPQSEVEARFDRFCHGRDTSLVLQISQLPIMEDWHDWDAERADLIQLQVSEDRLAALYDGAEPTTEEREWFNAAAKQDQEESSVFFCEVAHVYRVAAPEESAEKRAVYYCWIGHIVNQGSETVRTVGPLCDVAEVEKALASVTSEPFEFDFYGEYPEFIDYVKRLEKHDVVEKEGSGS